MRILDFLKDFDAADNGLITPYLIADAGVNHEGDMNLAKRLIDEAAEGGADAIKFQTYKAETIACKNSPAYWDTEKEPTKSQFELFKKYDSFWKSEYEQLKVHCDSAGIEFMSTPFDIESATFLNDLMDVFKISSSDITNKPFIEFMCDFGKPIILSTGAAYLPEIKAAKGWVDNKGNTLVLLHCVLNYPTGDADASLGMITGLRNEFPGNIIGYSDHTVPGDLKILEMATMLGARILEKHFTFDKTLPGNDHYHGMDKIDIARFRVNLKRIMEIVGSTTVTALEKEMPARQFARRSLVAARDIKAGSILQPEDITWKRPARGISPDKIDDVIGKKVVRDISDDEIIEWSALDV